MRRTQRRPYLCQGQLVSTVACGGCGTTCDGERSVADIDKELSSPGNNPEAGTEDIEKAWVQWVRKYKDIIETAAMVIGIAVALTSLWYVQRQLDQLADSDRAMSQQTSLLSQQVEALWYSGRPVLRMHPPKAEDIFAFDGPNPFPIDTWRFKIPEDEFSELSFTIENTGTSPASFDSVYLAVNYGDISLHDSTSWGNMTVSPQDLIRVPCSLPLLNSVASFIMLDIVYRWDRPNSPGIRFVLTRCMIVHRENDRWRIGGSGCDQEFRGFFIEDTTKTDESGP